jgi:hypothetical protein
MEPDPAFFLIADPDPNADPDPDPNADPDPDLVQDLGF